LAVAAGLSFWFLFFAAAAVATDATTDAASQQKIPLRITAGGFCYLIQCVQITQNV